MNETVINLFLAALPSLIVSLCMAWFNRQQKKRDEGEQKKEANRQRGDLVKLDLLVAGTTLSYACAMALKRGHANGEVEEGVKNYSKAIENFREFEREQLAQKG